MRKVAMFDGFYHICQFFNPSTDVNNGYGCDHPDQEEKRPENGKQQGCCYAHSCPLGIIPDVDDLHNPEVDWDGLCEDGELGGDDYIMVNTGKDATEDENLAWGAYDRWQNRYNQGYVVGGNA